jgi:hypothetical protein
MGDIVASASVTGKLGAISIGNDIARVATEVSFVCLFVYSLSACNLKVMVLV